MFANLSICIPYHVHSLVPRLFSHALVRIVFEGSVNRYQLDQINIGL